MTITETREDVWLGGETLHIPSFQEKHHTTAVAFDTTREKTIKISNIVSEHKLPIAAAVFTAGVVGSAAAVVIKKKI